MNKKYNDLIGDILESSGEKDNFTGKGKGKPLPKNYMEKDILQNFQEKAKNAGFLPPWLSLQKEIISNLQTAESDYDIKLINKKIKKYNLICPTSMQKPLISRESLDKAKNHW